MVPPKPTFVLHSLLHYRKGENLQNAHYDFSPDRFTFLGNFVMELAQGRLENEGPAVGMLFCKPQGCSSLLDW